MASDYENDMGDALTDMLEAAERYCGAYKREFDSPVGDDGVLGDEMASILRGLHGLLNGPRGRNSGGRLSKQIHELAEWAWLVDDNGEIRG